jgi:hypothetical protein
MQTRSRRRLALIGVLLLTQLMTACCLYPVGHRGGHRHYSGTGGR